MSRRVAGFVLFGALLFAGVGGYLLMGAGDSSGANVDAGPTGEAADLSVPYVAFRRTTIDSSYGTVGVVPLSDPGATPGRTGLTCERIHMSRGGGVCLRVDPGVEGTSEVLLLNPDMTVRHTLTTPGAPNRARVSPDGLWAATTTFVAGHSYATDAFSTQTEIYDMSSGASLGNLEQWRITYQGEQQTAIDTNVWGVTFAADGRSFYATVEVGEAIHLAKGEIADRSLEMLDVAAECPSLSPSGDLLAFKTAISPEVWQIRVRRISDGHEEVVAEARSVDDQIEWLDDQHVVYGLVRAEGATTDVWVAAADGSSPSKALIEGAWSPAVVN